MWKLFSQAYQVFVIESPLLKNNFYCGQVCKWWTIVVLALGEKEIKKHLNPKVPDNVKKVKNIVKQRVGGGGKFDS